MLSPGEVALYRSLRSGAVMKALPMRVICDSPERSALYLCPGTAFKTARTPDGNKVRDLSDWVSVDRLWAGGSLIRLTEPGAWHCVDVSFDSAGNFAEWYVNFQEPFRRSGSRFDTMDLVLDIVVAPDLSWHLKDENDFQRAVSDGQLSGDVKGKVLAEADRIIGIMAAGGSPFCESRWLTWRPPADWTVPLLPADWAR